MSAPNTPTTPPTPTMNGIPYTDILAWCTTCQRATGRFPTSRAIAAQYGISSTNTIFYHLQKMKDAGLIAQHGRYYTIPFKALMATGEAEQ